MAKKQQPKPATKKRAAKAPDAAKPDPKPAVEVAVGDKAVRFKHRNLTFIRAK